MNKIIEATHFAAKAHASQRRKNKAQDPYINHPIEVMRILSACGIEDPDVLCGAVLHDTIEDTGTTQDEIRGRFGEKVLQIVLECSDDKSLDKITRKKEQIKHAATICNEAKLVKLADKLSNLGNLLMDPPSNWSEAEILGYGRWGFRVCENCWGVNEKLDNLLKDLFTNKLSIASVSDEDLELYYGLLVGKK
jgi:guanosine-3',5'-bis(diphosphate) 3'-pyrophosphohydrolase